MEMDGLTHELASHPNPAYLGNLLRVMGHITRQWQAELDWARSIREEELSQPTASQEFVPHECT